jgi:hypothetical protein
MNLHDELSDLAGRLDPTATPADMRAFIAERSVAELRIMGARIEALPADEQERARIDRDAGGWRIMVGDRVLMDSSDEGRMREEAQGWIDRATELLGSNDAFVVWIKDAHRVPFSTSRPWPEHPGCRLSVYGDPRIEGTPEERERWMQQVSDYALEQIIVGVPPEDAIRIGE